MSVLYLGCKKVKNQVLFCGGILKGVEFDALGQKVEKYENVRGVVLGFGVYKGLVVIVRRGAT